MPRTTRRRPFPTAAITRILHTECDAEIGWLLSPGLTRPSATKCGIRARRDGLTAPEADLLATEAGVHPSTVWANWWDDSEAPEPYRWLGLSHPKAERRDRCRCSYRREVFGPHACATDGCGCA